MKQTSVPGGFTDEFYKRFEGEITLFMQLLWYKREYTQNILLSGITFIPNPKTLQKIQYMNINSKIHEERVKILANQANTMDHDHFGFILEI